MTRMLYQRIATLLQAMDNCRKTNNQEWLDKHGTLLEALCDQYLPSGSGIDRGTKLGGDSTPERLVFDLGFHHMNEYGSYDGWTEHTVIVTPSLANGINLRITGRDRNDIKEYLADVFYTALRQEIGNNEIEPLLEKRA